MTGFIIALLLTVISLITVPGFGWCLLLAVVAGVLLALTERKDN